MTSRTVLALAGIVLVVAGLSAYRCACRVEPARPLAASATGTATATAPGAPAAVPAKSPAAVSLPQVIDFGRDT